MKSYTKLRNLFGTLTTNQTPANLTLGDELMGDSYRRFIEKYFYNESSTSIVTVAQQQEYDLPFDYSKLKTGTLTIGQLKWNPTEILTRRDWDSLNVFPYYTDIPTNYFIWNEQKFNLWPIPSSSGKIITFNYKRRVSDLSFVDYITGTISATLNSKTVTGSGTGWLANYLPALPALLTNAIVATVSNLLSYTYANGTLGVGATITMSSAGILVIGGRNTVLNDVVLIKNESGDNAPYNGLYTVTTEGTPIVAAVLTRSTDNDQSTEFVGKAVFVTGTNVTYGYTNLSAPTIGTTAITTAIVGNVQKLNLWLQIARPSGDGEWYQIASIESATSLTLINTYQGGTTSGATYTIGQMPVLLEDYHDVIVYDALVTYFSSIVDNPTKLQEFTTRRDRIIGMMDDYISTKSLNVNLARPRMGQNPNLFPQTIG